MIIYLCGFAISCIFIFFAEKTSKKTRFIFFSVIAISIPCLIAGLRADTIGTDVRVYVRPLFLLAQDAKNFVNYLQSRWFGTWKYTYVYEIEIGFSILVYMTEKLTGSFVVLLILIQALIIVPVYKGLLYFRDKQPVWLGMAVFYLMFYNVSLNMMRQWIAMAILFYGIKYLIEKKFFLYFVLIGVSMLFHVTALFGVIIAWIYYYLYQNNGVNVKIRFGRIEVSGRSIRVLVLTLMMAMALLGLELIQAILRNYGFSKYVTYINGSIEVLPNQIILRLPFIILFAINWKKIFCKNEELLFLITMLIFDLILSQLGSISNSSWRIAAYFSEYNLLSYPLLCGFEKHKRGRNKAKALLISYLVLYWIYFFALKGAHQTVPYMFFNEIA